MADATNMLNCFLLEMFCSSFADCQKNCQLIAIPVSGLLWSNWKQTTLCTQESINNKVPTMKSYTYTPIHTVPNSIHRFEHASIILIGIANRFKILLSRSYLILARGKEIIIR